MNASPLQKCTPKAIAAIGVIALTAATTFGPAHADTIIRFDTSLGDIDVRLFDQDTPNTVANFLNYTNSDRFDQTFFHRVPQNGNVSSNFVVQGGGFKLNNSIFNAAGIVTDAPIPDEFNISNQRGTLAMAKNALGATSQFFFNLGDNSFLDAQGFTVFGEVINDTFTVVDAINALPTINASAAENASGEDFDEVPVTDLATVLNNNDITNNEAVLVFSVDVLPALPGDFNGSQSVEQGDLDLVLTNWGQDFNTANPAAWIQRQPTGAINQAQLDEVLTNWGSTAAPSFANQAVPEPATLASLTALACCLGLRRRQR